MIEPNSVIYGDCLDIMKGLEDNSVDAVVTDPPYGISFMNNKWDCNVPTVEIWQECLRVLKPGGYLLSFAGTRTQHQMAVNIEDAGFEIRDMIAWIYASGFPKSHNLQKSVSKIDPDSADEWEGWGSALKPAMEPITVARKPLAEKTLARNCLKYGTGGLNIDESRVPFEEKDFEAYKEKRHSFINTKSNEGKNVTFNDSPVLTPDEKIENSKLGRWPANVIHDGSEDVLELFAYTKSGAMKVVYKNTLMANSRGERNGKEIHLQQEANEGSAARFFYCAKASSGEKGTYNTHVTVKPLKLMEYLVKLVCRDAGVVLDPFAGSGTTGIACINTKRNYILIEKELEYIDIINKRIKEHTSQLTFDVLGDINE